MDSEPSTRNAADFLSVNFDKLATSGLKTLDEMRRHSIDQSLESKPVERALHLFTVGDEIQRLSVVQSLLELYRQDPSGCAQRLIPKLQQSLPMGSTEFHLATCAAIKTIMENKIMPLDLFTQTFLHTIVNGIDHRDPLVADAWVECLVDVIPSLPLSILQKDVQGPAILKGGSQKSVNSRVASCKIIGALCKKYPSMDVKRDLLPAVMTLCQDVNADVRTRMIQQLPFVVRPLGSETAKSMMLPILIDLAADEVPMVKEAAFAGVVDSIPYFTADIIIQSILPLLKQLMSYAFKYDNSVLLAVASSYGKMVTALERVIQSSDKESYTKSYLFIADKCSAKSKIQSKISQRQSQQAMSRLVGDKAVKCRQYCAYNYPAMAKFVYSETNKALLEGLHNVLVDLLTDSYYLVRRAITVSLHEVVFIYGKYRSLLRPELTKALRDQEEEVLDGFIPHLGEILVNLIRLSQRDEEPQSLDIVKALIDCDSYLVTSSNWRLYKTFITQLEVLWYLFPVDSVYNNFITLFFRRLYTYRALPVRLSCIRTILVNLKHTPKEVFRDESISKINELSNSSKFYERQFYLSTCEIILDVFSTSFFKEHFYLRTLQLADDPTPNIRWSLCRLLPKFQNMLKLPTDKKLQTSLEKATAQFELDKDSEVILQWKKTKSEMDSQTGTLFPQDQSRYDEEKKMFTLNQKMIQTFPWSVSKMFEPKILGEPALQRRSFSEQGTSTISTSVPARQVSSAGRPDSGGSSLPYGHYLGIYCFKCFDAAEWNKPCALDYVDHILNINRGGRGSPARSFGTGQYRRY